MISYLQDVFYQICERCFWWSKSLHIWGSFWVQNLFTFGVRLRNKLKKKVLWNFFQHRKPYIKDSYTRFFEFPLINRNLWRKKRKKFNIALKRFIGSESLYEGRQGWLKLESNRQIMHDSSTTFHRLMHDFPPNHAWIRFLFPGLSLLFLEDSASRSLRASLSRFFNSVGNRS